jgi:hypothetical protein
MQIKTFDQICTMRILHLLKRNAVMLYKYHFLLCTAIMLLVVTGCKKESLSRLEINGNNVVLHYDETFQFNIKVGNQLIPSESVQWNSSDEIRGTVDPSGLFKAGIIGSTVITGTYEGEIVTCEVTIVPRHTFFREPLTIMGSSTQAVKDYEERPVMAFPNYKDRLDYIEESTNILDLAYVFDKDKLQLILIAFGRNPDLYELIINFYKERYIFERTINQGLIFVDRDKTLSIQINVNPFQFPPPSIVEIVYLPYSPRYNF